MAGVVLREVDRFAAIVPHAGLMLAESVDRFGGTVAAEGHVVFGAVGLLAVHGDRRHGLGVVVQQDLA